MQSSFQQTFPPATVFQIICRSELAIRIQNTTDFNKSRITCATPNPQDLSQLWFIGKTKDNCYQIVNALSELCLQGDGEEFRLQKPNWSAGQLLHLQKSPIQEYYQYYWIKVAGYKKAAALQGILRYKSFDVGDHAQLFRFVPITNENHILNTTVFIENPLSQKVLDVPHASMKGGVQLIQYKKSGRFNQRWLIQKTGNAYQIRSFKTNLNVDINRQSKKPGEKIIQWEPTGAPNQLWTVQNVNNDIYTIRSVLNPSLVMAIENNSLDDEAKVITIEGTFYWRLEGFKK